MKHLGPKLRLERPTIGLSVPQECWIRSVFWSPRSWTGRIAKLPSLRWPVMKNGMTLILDWWKPFIGSLISGSLELMACWRIDSPQTPRKSSSVLDNHWWESRWPFRFPFAIGLISFMPNWSPRLSFNDPVATQVWLSKENMILHWLRSKRKHGSWSWMSWTTFFKNLPSGEQGAKLRVKCMKIQPCKAWSSSILRAQGSQVHGQTSGTKVWAPSSYGSHLQWVLESIPNIYCSGFWKSGLE